MAKVGLSTVTEQWKGWERQSREYCYTEIRKLCAKSIYHWLAENLIKFIQWKLPWGLWCNQEILYSCIQSHQIDMSKIRLNQFQYFLAALNLLNLIRMRFFQIGTILPKNESVFCVRFCIRNTCMKYTLIFNGFSDRIIEILFAKLTECWSFWYWFRTTFQIFFHHFFFLSVTHNSTSNFKTPIQWNSVLFNSPSSTHTQRRNSLFIQHTSKHLLICNLHVESDITLSIWISHWIRSENIEIFKCQIS